MLTDLESIELLYGPPDKILSASDFKGYQRWMVRKAVELPYCYLAAEMGLGKTAVCLKAAQIWRDRLGIKKTLVIAPKNVAVVTWPDEIAKWDFARSLRYSVIVGTPEEREAAVRMDADIYIVNRENLPWLYWHLPGRKWQFDALIYDEASRLKSGKARTAVRKDENGEKIGGGNLSGFAMLCRRRSGFRRVVELSGTPTPNGMEDLWGQIFVLDKGKRLGKFKTHFLRKYFIYDAYRKRYFPKPGAFDAVMGKVGDIMFSLREEDYVELPDCHYLPPTWVTLPPRARATYQRLARDFVLQEHDIEAVNSAVLANKLLQLANGSIYNSEREAVGFHEAKLDALEEIIRDSDGEPVMVAYSFDFDKNAILKRFPKARLFSDPQTDTRDWNAGRIPILVLHPASAGHGMNFQFGGRRLVWYGLTANLEWYLQANKRLHRRGQKRPVLIYRILARDTFDERMLKLLDNKETIQDDVMDAVRVYKEMVNG